MKHVAYIIETQNKEYKGFIAILNPDGDDSALFVTNSTKRFEKLEDVQEEMKKLPSEIDIYPNPIKPNESGLSWLSELKAANPVQ